MADDQLRTRLLAYRIWEAEGCPDGQEERHWHLACRLVAAERITDVPQDAPPAGRVRDKGASADDTPPRGEGASGVEKGAVGVKAPSRRRSAGSAGAGAKGASKGADRVAGKSAAPGRRRRAAKPADDDSSPS